MRDSHSGSEMSFDKIENLSYDKFNQYLRELIRYGEDKFGPERILTRKTETTRRENGYENVSTEEPVSNTDGTTLQDNGNDMDTAESAAIYQEPKKSTKKRNITETTPLETQNS